MATIPINSFIGVEENDIALSKGKRALRTRTVKQVQWLTKPDNPMINPRGSDGYRKPSSWSAKTNLFVPAIRSGEAVDRTGGVSYFSGTTVLRPYNWNPVLRDHVGHNAINHIRTKILNNVRDEILDASMVLAEMQGTVNTASTMLNRIGRSMLALQRRKPASFYYLLNGRRKDGRRPTQRFLKETSNEYLQWKYGIMPSVYDLQGALKGLDMNESGSLFNNPPLLVARASDVSISTSSGTMTTGLAHTRIPYESKVEVKARLDFSVKAEGLRGLNRYGIGLSTIPTVLWDKTPFTFVLDMAIPIASIIKAWGALSGVEVRGYCETQYMSIKTLPHTFNHDSGTSNGSNAVLVTCHPAEMFEFERKAYNTVPMPLPYVKNPVSTGNLSTILALFTSLRKG